MSSCLALASATLVSAALSRTTASTSLFQANTLASMNANVSNVGLGLELRLLSFFCRFFFCCDCNESRFSEDDESAAKISWEVPVPTVPGEFEVAAGRSDAAAGESSEGQVA